MNIRKYTSFKVLFIIFFVHLSKHKTLVFLLTVIMYEHVINETITLLNEE